MYGYGIVDHLIDRPLARKRRNHPCLYRILGFQQIQANIKRGNNACGINGLTTSQPWFAMAGRGDVGIEWDPTVS
jgi:hypothetical protein